MKPNQKKLVITPKEVQMLKNASFAQVYGWAFRIYRQGFEDGLREAETEFDDPELYQIINADDAKEKLGEEAYRRLTDGSN